MYCQMLNFGQLSVENMNNNTTPIDVEQFKLKVPHWLVLNGVCHHVLSVHGMTIVGLGVHLPNRLVVKQTIYLGLYQHYIASSTNYSN